MTRGPGRDRSPPPSTATRSPDWTARRASNQTGVIDRSQTSTASSAPMPHGARTSWSGSTSRTRSQLTSTDTCPSWPRRSQPPARRTISGTQCPDEKGGSSHSRTTTRRGATPARRRSRTRSSTAARRWRRISMRPTASSSASANAPTVEMPLKMPSTVSTSRVTIVGSMPSVRTAVSTWSRLTAHTWHMRWVRMRSGRARASASRSMWCGDGSAGPLTREPGRRACGRLLASSTQATTGTSVTSAGWSSAGDRPTSSSPRPRA